MASLKYSHCLAFEEYEGTATSVAAVCVRSSVVDVSSAQSMHLFGFPVNRVPKILSRIPLCPSGRLNIEVGAKSDDVACDTGCVK